MGGRERVGSGPAAESAADEPAPVEQAGFDAAFSELQATVLRSCSSRDEWPARIAAGIRAALEFAARNPVAASTLTIEEAAARSGADGGRHPELIEYFAAQLGEVVPPQERLSTGIAEALVSTVVAVVVIHLRCGTTERLEEAAADLIHLTLLPYAGFAEAQQWAELYDR